MSEQDVLDKIEDVIEKIEIVEDKVGTLINRNELWQLCGDCRGEGKLYGMDGSSEGGTPTERDCPLCTGTGKLKYGTQEEG